MEKICFGNKQGFFYNDLKSKIFSSHYRHWSPTYFAIALYREEHFFLKRLIHVYILCLGVEMSPAMCSVSDHQMLH